MDSRNLRFTSKFLQMNCVKKKSARILQRGTKPKEDNADELEVLAMGNKLAAIKSFKSKPVSNLKNDFIASTVK